MELLRDMVHQITTWLLAISYISFGRLLPWNKYDRFVSKPRDFAMPILGRGARFAATFVGLAECSSACNCSTNDMLCAPFRQSLVLIYLHPPRNPVELVCYTLTSNTATSPSIRDVALSSSIELRRNGQYHSSKRKIKGEKGSLTQGNQWHRLQVRPY